MHADGVGIAAILVAVAIACGLGWGSQVTARRLAPRYVEPLAGARSAFTATTLTLQRTALETPRLLPIYGSSELYMFGDPYRPSQLFAGQPTGFGAFPVGQIGTGDLFFAQTFGALGHALGGKKVVVSDSPVWFAHRNGLKADAYTATFAPEIARAFVFEAPISMPLREAVAQRMLAYPETLAHRPLLRLAVRALAASTFLHRAVYRALVPLGRIETWIDRAEDGLRTHRVISASRHVLPAAVRDGPVDWRALAARATAIASRHARTNPFGFSDDAYERARDKGPFPEALALYRSGATNRDGQTYPEPVTWEDDVAHSTEFTDLRLMLDVLRELGARPLVWTLPMPGYFDDYTRLSRSARRTYYDRWDAVVAGAGVPWLDFAGQEEDPYFVMDAASHLSPRGWIFADVALDMFWHDRSIDDVRAAIANLAGEVPSPATAGEGAR